MLRQRVRRLLGIGNRRVAKRDAGWTVATVIGSDGRAFPVAILTSVLMGCDSRRPSRPRLTWITQFRSPPEMTASLRRCKWFVVPKTPTALLWAAGSERKARQCVDGQGLRSCANTGVTTVARYRPEFSFSSAGIVSSSRALLLRIQAGSGSHCGMARITAASRRSSGSAISRITGSVSTHSSYGA